MRGGAKFINQLDWRDSGIHNVIINKVSAITSDSLLQQQLAGLREDLSIYTSGIIKLALPSLRNREAIEAIHS